MPVRVDAAMLDMMKKVDRVFTKSLYAGRFTLARLAASKGNMKLKTDKPLKHCKSVRKDWLTSDVGLEV
ncbi:hypothetical protein N4R57_20340 [Rhodobacteraceae bacterium D3-12]|nr:hypothetical protein N4R57_20340 [Rhodobacteraceae bacterium D3-12]